MNVWTGMGRLTKDPEWLDTTSGIKMAMFTLAVDRANRDGGTDFIGIKCFGATADNVLRYMSKGRQVAVEGRIETGSYTNKEGRKVYTTDVIANRVEFIGGRDDGSGRRTEEQRGGKMPQTPTGNDRTEYAPKNQMEWAVDDESIPF